MQRPLIFVTIALVFGMALGAVCGAGGLVLAALTSAICLLVLISCRLGPGKFQAVLGLWFCALGMAWFLLYQEPHSLLSQRVGSETAVTAEIRTVKDFDTRQVLTVKLLKLEQQQIHNGELCQVYVNAGPGTKYKYGEIIEFSGIPELIPENGNPGLFSYRVYEQKKGVFTQIKPISSPKVTGTGGNLVSAVVEWFRAKTTGLTLGVMENREASVFLGILFGDTGNMSETDQETFSITGVLHAFAVSGSNVAFVLFFGLMLFEFLPRRLGLAATALLVIFYAVLSGAEGPVVRAAIMALLVIGGKLLGRRGDGLNSLFIAALAMLLYNPGYLKDPGFQLSFAATWGLIVLVPALTPTKVNLSLRVKELVIFPIAAQIATFPLLAYYFNQISLIGVVANVLVTWFLAVILEVGLAAVSVGLILPQVGSLFLLPLVYLIKLTTMILELMAKIPGAALWVITPPVWTVCLYYVLLLTWIYGKQLRATGKFTVPIWLKKTLAFTSSFKIPMVALVCLLLVVSLSLAIPSNRKLEVEFLDVGQGDSALITTPSGKHYLLDGGNRNDKFDTGKSILLPYLFAQKIKALDGVILSHPHDDHDGGLVTVVQALKVNDFFVPGVELPKEESIWWQPLYQEVVAKGIPMRKLRAGQTVELDSNLYLQVFAPDQALEGTHSDPNNNSLVLQLVYGSNSVLFTGDIELEAIKELKDKDLLRNSVIKIPHHGSRFGLDKEFWDGFNPPLVVISVGKNSFGHPAPEVCRYWQDRNIPVLRTDHQGLIKLSMDGQSLTVSTGRKKEIYKQ